MNKSVNNNVFERKVNVVFYPNFSLFSGLHQFHFVLMIKLSKKKLKLENPFKMEIALQNFDNQYASRY